MKIRIGVALACLVLCAAPLHAATPAGAAPFDDGVKAYRAGDYATALAAFLEAQPSGWSAANLQFNLGLAYYKLHRYPEARAAFERLRAYPGYAPIADYHLGLIAAQLGEKERALALWQPLAASAPEQALRDRAAIALGRLDDTAGPGAYVTGAAGVDTNPALLDESAGPAGNNASGSLDLLGTVESVLARADDHAWTIRGGGYLREYTEHNGLDQGGVFAGLEWAQDGPVRRTLLAADLGTGWLDGAHFLDAVSAGWTNAPQAGTEGWAFGAQLTRIHAATAFDYLTGWRIRGTADWRARRWRLGYGLEFNDRADLEASPEFFSHSPIRQSLGLIVPRPGPAGWSLQYTARYRYSWYRDPDIVAPSLQEERRQDHLFEIGARVRRQVSPGSFVFADYGFSRNASTIGAFAYDRHVLQLGVEWTTAGR